MVSCRRPAGDPLGGSTESWPWRGALLLQGPSPWIAAIYNPFGVEGLGVIYNLVDASLEALSYGVFGVPGVVSLYFLFRRAGRVEHQQINWFAYAGAVLLR